MRLQIQKIGDTECRLCKNYLFHLIIINDNIDGNKRLDLPLCFQCARYLGELLIKNTSFCNRIERL